jgi:hypothetical protein
MNDDKINEHDRLTSSQTGARQQVGEHVQSAAGSCDGAREEARHGSDDAKHAQAGRDDDAGARQAGAAAAQARGDEDGDARGWQQRATTAVNAPRASENFKKL